MRAGDSGGPPEPPVNRLFHKGVRPLYQLDERQLVLTLAAISHYSPLASIGEY